jgi:hypothetical protein
MNGRTWVSPSRGQGAGRNLPVLSEKFDLMIIKLFHSNVRSSYFLTKNANAS